MKSVMALICIVTHTHSYYMLHRKSYMSVHVLSNLLNELRKRDKMRGMPNILSLFRNLFNKFNNTGARMNDKILFITCHKKLI